MPIETRWYIPNRLVYIHYHGIVTVEEYKESNEQVARLMMEGTPLVHAIADLRDIERWPSLIQLSKVARTKPYPNMGWGVIVVANPILRFIATVLVQFVSSHFHTVSTMDDALKFLSERDNTLTVNH